MVFKPHFISTDTYKLKVEKTIKGVLGRPGGRGEGGEKIRWENLWIFSPLEDW